MTERLAGLGRARSNWRGMSDILDPTNAPHPEMNRSAFVGLSAGVIAAAVSGARALGDVAPLGAPHPPFVPEDDPSITCLRPMLERPAGNIDAYAAIPHGSGVRTPGVVVVHHIWGVDAQIRDVVRRLAKAGYVAIAPNLFARQHPPSGDGASDFKIFSPFAQALVDDQSDGDLQASCAWIRSRAGAAPAARPPNVGITGFCMGGTITLREAVDSPQFDAAAMWYGKIRQTANPTGAATEMSLDYADEIKMPLCGSFGARDTSIPAADVAALRARLTVPNDLKVYDEAGHGFFDDTRPSYAPTAATDAWARTLAWFAKYLAS